MYCIGVTGRCGAGKTTFSYYLHNEISQSVHIQADGIMYDAVFAEKELLIQLYGNNIIREGKVDRNLYMSDNNNVSIIEKIISPKIKTTLKDKIDELVLLNQNVVIILDWFRLPDCTEIWQNCKTKILIKAIDENLRWFYRNQRNKMTVQELALRDKMIDFDNFLYDEIITNNYNDDFVENAKRMAKKIIQ